MIKKPEQKKEELVTIDSKDIMPNVEKLKKQVIDKYKERIKCIVIMGSVARGEFQQKSDVDLFVVIDDTDKPIEMDEKARIDSDIVKMAQDISLAISVQPLYTLTEFMDFARVAHPIIYNFIKEGKAIYDTGFFTPFKRLLEMGKIPATREAVESYMDGAPKKIMRAKTVKLLMLAEDCYYAILNTAQAVLMFMGLEPPVPNKAHDEVIKYLVEPGILEQKYADWLRDIIEVRKKIEHKELMDVTGAFVDEWIDKSDEFINKMYDLLSILETRKKEKVLERTYDVMRKAAISALSSLKKMPEDEKKVSETFKREIVDKHMVDGYYWDMWKKIEIMKDLADKHKVDKLDEKEVYRMREYVRNLIRDLSRAIKEDKN
ncbi:MAG: nucleotidyltransferase domain-containing protein [Candidatus Aenigmarchaeota archaeon]|nr:nucleotidyltransferase domain-containing protein [Candidatus Aenigmarchaeota archaeon]